MARPVGLCQRIATERGHVNALRRELPKPPLLLLGQRRKPDTQTPEQASAAYWLERAAYCLQQAENAWDAADG